MPTATVFSEGADAKRRYVFCVLNNVSVGRKSFENEYRTVHYQLERGRRKEGGRRKLED